MAGRQVFLDDVGASDIGGHQVRRELNAPEREIQRVGDRTHHQSLRRARQACNQTVAAHEERDQHLVQNLVLAHDHLAHLLDDAFAHRVKAFDALLELCCVRIQVGKCSSSHQFPSLSVHFCAWFNSSNIFCAGR